MRLILATAACAALLAGGAGAHDFYSGRANWKGESCCGLNDCAAIPDRAVRLLRNGYAVTVGELEAVIPFERALPSPDGRFHACVWGGEIKCLFAPPLGA